MARRPSLGNPPPARVEPPPPLPERTATARTPARVGKQALQGFIDADAKLQLDVYASMNRRTIQSIIEEMYNDFAHKHGLHRLAASDRAA